MPTNLDPIAELTDADRTEAQAKTWFTNLRAALAEMGDPLSKYGLPQNLALSCSVGSNALTIALKTRDGNDPSAASPVSIPFRSVTAANGDYSVINVTAANSLVISSGSSLGTSNSTPFRFWIVAFNDGGALRLGAINCLSGTNIFPLKDDDLRSSTAEGGAGAADSAHVIYTGTAVSSKAMRVLGYLEYSSGLAAAGTYASAPTKVQLFAPGLPLPGQRVQAQRTDTGAVATGSTTIPADDTIPQNTEGDQYMTQAITPTSAANVLSIDTQAHLFHSAQVGVVAALFQDSVASALRAIIHAVATGESTVLNLKHRMRAATTSATTFKVRAGGSGAGTTTFNGQSGARFFGGVMNSYLEVEEVMA